MSIYAGKHPVFVSHTEEIEQLAWFLADLQNRLQKKGLIPESENSDEPVRIGKEKYQCLLRVRAKCSDLLLRMSAEDSDIILLDDTDTWWVRNIVYYVHDVIRKDRQKVG